MRLGPCSESVTRVLGLVEIDFTDKSRQFLILAGNFFVLQRRVTRLDRELHFTGIFSAPAEIRIVSISLSLKLFSFTRQLSDHTDHL